MSTGAVFKLIANDGKADRLIMATALLNQRIKDVMCSRAAAGKEDPTPTLVDLEHTHILYVNAHFKPYAAIGFEYNKVRPTAGAVALGTRLTFSIPQFGDFFHDMVLRTRLGVATGATGPLPVAGGPYVPATLLPGTSGFPGNPLQSTGATLYMASAYVAINGGVGPTFANPVSTTNVSGIFTAIIANYIQGVGPGATTTYDASTYAYIQRVSQAYWTDANITAFVNTAGNPQSITSATAFVNAMFSVALSTHNPSFSYTITQLQYGNISSATTFGLYYGFMAAVAASAVGPTSINANAYITQIQNVLNVVTWTVPQFANYNLVDAFGNYIEVPVGNTSPASYRNLVRYCEFPGNRAVANVRFDVNGNPLDQYSSYASVMLEKFTVPTHKRIGYNRLAGQAVPLAGISGPSAATVSDADAANTPGGIGRWAATQSNSTVALFAPGTANSPTNFIGGSLIDPTIPANVTLNQFPTQQVDVGQRVINWVNGPQTPKPVQPPLELWHKLRFWFCDDVRQSIPSVAIPFGQRFITVDLASASQLVFEFPSLYLQTVTSAPQVTVNGSQFVVASQRTVTCTPINQLFGVNAPALEAAEMYINNIFVNPEIHDVYIKRIGFSLIRVYREHSVQVQTANGARELLSQLKWPIEYMFIGVQPTWNTTPPTLAGGNNNMWRDWHRMTRQVDAFDPTYCNAQMAASSTGSVSFDTTASTAPDVQAGANSIISLPLAPAVDPVNAGFVWNTVQLFVANVNNRIYRAYAENTAILSYHVDENGTYVVINDISEETGNVFIDANRKCGVVVGSDWTALNMKGLAFVTGTIYRVICGGIHLLYGTVHYVSGTVANNNVVLTCVNQVGMFSTYTNTYYQPYSVSLSVEYQVNAENTGVTWTYSMPAGIFSQNALTFATITTLGINSLPDPITPIQLTNDTLLNYFYFEVSDGMVIGQVVRQVPGIVPPQYVPVTNVPLPLTNGNGAGGGATMSITNAGFQTLNTHLINSGGTATVGISAPASTSGSRFGQIVPDQYWLNVPTVDSMSLVAHGVTIYDDFQDLFYSGYTPYQYGCANVTTPDDPGAFLVNMALFPRSYQPSGHLNISRARETYLAWNSSYVSSKTSAQLIVVAVAINFLLISDGSAVLRYST